MNCTATHDTLTCCRLDFGDALWTRPHPMPHMAHDGQQWDDHGIRQARGNDPWKGQVR